jgi:hypothetical protein
MEEVWKGPGAMANLSWRADHKGYVIVTGRHFHNGGQAHFTIWRPRPGQDDELVYESVCIGTFVGDDADDRAWAAAQRDARDYIDRELDPLT